MTPPDNALRSLEDAWRIIIEHVRSGPSERVPLADAHGRALAEPIHAAYDYPPFDKAMMDGYAIRAADSQSAPCELRLVGEAPAGSVPQHPLAPGQAIRINTGAPLPLGADAVIPVEETEPTRSADSVRIRTTCKLGRCIAPRGSVSSAGRTILAPPLRLTSTQLSAAAAGGASHVNVVRVPTVSIVVTGDELARPGTQPGPGQIVESNDTTLSAFTRECGAVPISLGITRDDPAALRSAFAAALKQPIVVAVGGMSKGTLDLVPAAFEQLGVKWLFHGVDLRPGKPTAYGFGPDGQHVFGLPGNPVSCLVCYLLFVRIAISGLCGFPPARPSRLRTRLEGAIKSGKDPRPAFLPAFLSTNGEPLVRPVAWHGSGDPFSIAAANAFIFQPRGDLALESGSLVDVLPMPAMFG